MFGRKRRRKGTSEGLNGARYDNGNDHLIECRRLVKTYHTTAGDFPALKEIDLQVDGGEFVAVIGKSGSGKSTLVNMITGIDRPTAGEVLVGDASVGTLSEGQLAQWRGRTIGVIFQFFQLLPTLTVVENVMLPMDFCHMYTMRERRERAMHLLEQVDVADHAHKLPSAVSGGNSSAWPLPGRWPTIRRSWPPTSPPAISIPRRRIRSSGCLRAWWPRARRSSW